MKNPIFMSKSDLKKQRREEANAAWDRAEERRQEVEADRVLELTVLLHRVMEAAPCDDVRALAAHLIDLADGKK